MRPDDVGRAVDALISRVPKPAVDAASTVVQGHQRIIRRRVVLTGVAFAVLATIAAVGAVVNNDDARRVVAPVPTTATTEPGFGPSPMIAVASPLEAWKCLDPLQYTDDGGHTWSSVTIPHENLNPPIGCTAVEGGNLWAVTSSTDGRRYYIVRVQHGTYVQVRRFTQLGTSQAGTDDQLFAAPVFVDADHGWIETDNEAGQSSLFRTVDGGTTWKAVASHPHPGLVGFTDPKHGYFFPSWDEMLASSDAGATWKHVPGPAKTPGGYPKYVRRVVVRDGSIIAWSAAGDGSSAMHTFFDVSHDGGRTWTRRNAPVGAGVFDAADESHWFALSAGALHVTDDAGRTWHTRPAVPNVQEVGTMVFPTADVGWITSDSGIIMRTIDAGRTWSDVTNSFTIPTTTTTATTPFAGAHAPPARLAFASATEGWVCDNRFEYTTDTFATAAHNVEIPAPKPRAGTYDRQTKLCATAPGGNAWYVRTSADLDQPEIVRIRSGGSDVQVFPFVHVPESAIESISFVDADNGWALVRSLARTPRALYRTQDGGATWSVLLRDAPPWSSIDFETLDRGWAAAERGAQLVTTTDGGRTWQAVEVPTPAPHRSLPLNAWKVQVDGNVVVAFSGQTTGNFFTPFFDVSSDGGRTWRRSRGPRALLRSQPNAFDAADADHWALAWSKYLYVTDDGGKTWVERAESAGINSIEDIARLDANVAFISGIADSSNQPVVLKTTDGGETWAPVR